jgi:hypothetical protein
VASRFGVALGRGVAVSLGVLVGISVGVSVAGGTVGVGSGVGFDPQAVASRAMKMINTGSREYRETLIYLSSLTKSETVHYQNTTGSSAHILTLVTELSE